MSPDLHHRAALLTLGLAILQGGPLQGDESREQDPLSLEALLQETEDLVSGAPSGEETSPPETEAVFIALGSIQAGPGYSSNYLKATQPRKSAYLHAEADTWMGWFAPSWTASGYIFAETNLYEEEKEYLTLSRFTGNLSRGVFDFGTELMIFYGDQVYDSSLNDIDGLPTGLLIEQFLPSLSLFADWFATDRNRFRVEPLLQRLEFDIAGQDYWEPGLGLEWEHLWTASLRSETGIRVSRELYDDDRPRQADGTPLAGTGTLKVDTLSLSQDISWEARDWLELKLYVGISRDRDSEGVYKDRTRAWGGGLIRLDAFFGKLSLNGRYTELDYESRLANFLGPETARQTYINASLEYERSLLWDLVLHLKASWAEVDSRTVLESYQEERGELLLEWRY